jgi:hypothetical protein
VEKPTVGRIVHYVSYGTPKGEYESTCRAAIVAETFTTDNEEVGLCVLNPTGIFFNTVLHDENRKGPGTWHWPEREEVKASG